MRWINDGLSGQPGQTGNFFLYLCALYDTVPDWKSHAIRGRSFYGRQRISRRDSCCVTEGYGWTQGAARSAGERRAGRPGFHRFRGKRNGTVHPPLRHRNRFRHDAGPPQCTPDRRTGQASRLGDSLRRTRANAEPVPARDRPQGAAARFPRRGDGLQCGLDELCRQGVCPSGICRRGHRPELPPLAERLGTDRYQPDSASLSGAGHGNVRQTPV